MKSSMRNGKSSALATIVGLIRELRAKAGGQEKGVKVRAGDQVKGAKVRAGDRVKEVKARAGNRAKVVKAREGVRSPKGKTDPSYSQPARHQGFQPLKS